MEQFRRKNADPRFPFHHLDFEDVFGGPPRTASLRRGGQSLFPERMRFYDEIFSAEVDDDFQRSDRSVMSPASTLRSPSRNLPIFEIPGSRREALRGGHGFYGDVLRLVDGSSNPYESGFRSKSTSSRSSTRGPFIQDDVELSAVASKLKPINVSSQRYVNSCSEQNTHGNLTVASVGSYMEYTDPATDCCKQSTYSAKFDQHHLSPLSHTSHMSLNQQYMKSRYDITYCNPERNSPSSVTTSTVHEPEVLVELSEKVFKEDYWELEFGGNYMIEIVPQPKMEETDEVGAVDDVIAWVREMYKSGDSKFSEMGKTTDRRNSFSNSEKAKEKKHELHHVSEAEADMQVMETEFKSFCSKQPICSILCNENPLPRRSQEELLRKQMFYHEDHLHRRSQEELFKKQMVYNEDYAHRRLITSAVQETILYNEDYARRWSHDEQLRKQMGMELMSRNIKIWSQGCVE